MSEKFQRDLVRGSLDLMVLSVLAGGKKYGYLIQKDVREASASRVDLQTGTLYPLLHSLQADGLVESRQRLEDGRLLRYYKATPAGEITLAAARSAVAELAGELLADPDHDADGSAGPPKPAHG